MNYIYEQIREVAENHFSDVYNRDEVLSHFPEDANECLESKDFVCRIIPEQFPFTEKAFKHISSAIKVVSKNVTWIDYDGDMWEDQLVCDVYFPNFIS